MVYVQQNQTKRYPVVPDRFLTTNQHFLDNPVSSSLIIPPFEACGPRHAGC